MLSSGTCRFHISSLFLVASNPAWQISASQILGHMHVDNLTDWKMAAHWTVDLYPGRTALDRYRFATNSLTGPLFVQRCGKLARMSLFSSCRGVGGCTCLVPRMPRWSVGEHHFVYPCVICFKTMEIYLRILRKGGGPFTTRHFISPINKTELFSC